MTTAISGRPARSIDNAFCETSRRNPGFTLDYPPAYDAGKRWRQWRKRRANGVWRIGQDRGQDDQALPAADLMQALIREGGFSLSRSGGDGDLPLRLRSDFADV